MKRPNSMRSGTTRFIAGTTPFIIMLPTVMLFAIACERASRPQGDQQGSTVGAPAYTAIASVSKPPGRSHITSIAPQVAAAPDGEALYQQHCVACHQVTGKGIPGAFPPLDASPYVVGDNVERLAAILIYGLQGPINVLGTTYTSAMAPLGGTMNDAELAAVATFTRSSWTNSADPVEHSVFTEARKKYGARAMFTIAELGEEQ